MVGGGAHYPHFQAKVMLKRLWMSMVARQWVKWCQSSRQAYWNVHPLQVEAVRALHACLT
jgi:hypothetical protein